MPYEKDFCASCNRLRVSAKGKLHLCLFGEEGIDIRPWLQNDEQQTELQQRLMAALQGKREHHFYIKVIARQTASCLDRRLILNLMGTI